MLEYLQKLLTGPDSVILTIETEHYCYERAGIIAVDPTVIPLGSRVYIQYPDGHGEYAIAEDTGGAIKGNRVDVAKWTVNEAQDFGIQKVKVYVVSTPEKV